MKIKTPNPTLYRIINLNSIKSKFEYYDVDLDDLTYLKLKYNTKIIDYTYHSRKSKCIILSNYFTYSEAMDILTNELNIASSSTTTSNYCDIDQLSLLMFNLNTPSL